MPHVHRLLPGPHRGRIVAHYTPELTRADYVAMLQEICNTLSQSTSLQINDVTVKWPGSTEFELVYERTPHDTRAFVLRAEWPEEQEPVAASGRLSIGVASDGE